MGLGIAERMDRIELQQFKKRRQKLGSYRESPAALYHAVVVRYHCLLILIEPWIRPNDDLDLSLPVLVRLSITRGGAQQFGFTAKAAQDEVAVILIFLTPGPHMPT